MEPLVKLFSYWFAKSWKSFIDNYGPQFSQVELEHHVSSAVYSILRNYHDFLVHFLKEQPNIAKSKLNNPDYGIPQLKQDSDHWHDWLAKQKRKSAAPGRKVELANMPTGYYWVSLDTHYCDKESEAMGHCGNSGGAADDNIWSLRDAKGIPHLTFIVNNKMLGESKGFGNEKPEPKYHPHIIAFLLGEDHGESIVEYIKGGGYRPQNNFSLNDLNPATKEQLLKQKPQLADYFLSLNKIAKGDPVQWKKEIDYAFNFTFDSLAPPYMIVKKAEHMEDLIDWLKDETRSSLDQIPDFQDGFYDQQYDVSNSEIRDYYRYASQANKNLIKKLILKKIEDSGEDRDDIDDELAWALDNYQELADVLMLAVEDGLRSGEVADAYDTVKKFLRNETDQNGHGFMIQELEGGAYQIIISFEDLQKILEELGDDSPFTDFIYFKYNAPYNGYYGFSQDVFNERLGETLHDLQAA
jgi:hypothetical protein